MDLNQFLDKCQKVPVEHYPHNVADKPLVSVCVQTYQHAPFIRECLDGILMQETEFRYEILLGEDASTDGTREICIEYAEKYPDKIRLFLHHRENNIKINGRATGRFNLLYNLYSAKGKYIALCEGDDYWTDPDKLQNQINFMRQNEKCSLCFTGCKIQYMSGRKKTIRYSLVELLDVNSYLTGSFFMATAGLMFRAEVLRETPYENWILKCFAADFVIRYRALTIGKIGYIDHISVVYNKGTAGSWSNRNLTREIVKKELEDHQRALEYLLKYSSLNESVYILRRKKIKAIFYYKTALAYGGVKGLLYLIIRINKIGLRRFFSYLRK